MDVFARGQCQDSLAVMDLDGRIQGVAGAGRLGIVWQYDVTVEVNGVRVHLLGEGETVEEAACATLDLVKRYDLPRRIFAAA